MANKKTIFLLLSLSLHLAISTSYLLKYLSFSQLKENPSGQSPSPWKSIFDKNDEKKLVAQQRIKKVKIKFKQQIVESHNPEIIKKPTQKVDQLSDKSRRVDRETVAKRSDSFDQASAKQENKKLTGTAATAQLNAPAKKMAPQAKKNPLNLTLSDLAMSPANMARMHVAEQSKVLISASNEKKVEQIVQTQVQGVDPHKERGQGQGNKNSSNDYLPHLVHSDMTRLNTEEYKFFGFYQRLKRQLEQHWSLLLKEKAKKIGRSGRKIASEEDFITSLAVEIEPSGRIKSLSITSSSGVMELDQAAVESFNKAGPFPNPPQEMVVQGGGVAKIQWGFVVKS